MVTIISTTEQNDLAPDTGAAIKRMRVKWKIDATHGPYVDFFPVEGFDGAAALDALNKRAAEIAKLIGKK